MSEALIIFCSSCRAANRVPRDRIADVPVCASCATRLLGQAPAELDEEGLALFASRSDLPVLVDLWAPWCGPCRTMAPHFAGASERLAGRVLLAKVDTEAHPAVAQRYEVRSIPTMLLLHHDREVARHVGALDTGQIVAWAEQHAPAMAR